MKDMRNLIDVINAMIAVVPQAETEFLVPLDDFRSNVEFAAPERMFFWWAKIAGFLEETFPAPADLKAWQRDVVAIWTAKEAAEYPRAKQITVWACGFGHEHKSLEAAKKCIARQAASPHRAGHLSERNREAILMRVAGQTYKAIGERFGVGPNNFRPVYRRELRRLRHPLWLKGFSDFEKRVVMAEVEAPEILRDLFLRIWAIRDGEE